MTGSSAVLSQRRQRVLVITLNRPEQRNAINSAVATGIAAALDELDRDPECSVGVLTGSGKGFSA
jgi:enoyl-CoA hydratase